MPCKLILTGRNDFGARIESSFGDSKNIQVNLVGKDDATVIDSINAAILIAKDFNSKNVSKLSILIYDTNLQIHPNGFDKLAGLDIKDCVEALVCRLRCETCERKICTGAKSLTAENKTTSRK